MPTYKTIYDKGDPKAVPPVEPGKLVRDVLTADEAIRNDPGRYSYKPWKERVVSRRDDARARGANMTKSAAEESEGATGAE
jgi:hypothetical protein